MFRTHPILSRLLLLVWLGVPMLVGAVFLYDLLGPEIVITETIADRPPSARDRPGLRGQPADRRSSLASDIRQAALVAPGAEPAEAAESAGEDTAAGAWSLETDTGDLPPPLEADADAVSGQGGGDPLFVDPAATEEMSDKDSLLGMVAEASWVASVDPVYLMALADKESNFRPGAEAKQSSATGMYQFTEATWLETIKRVGPKYGLQADADAIRMVRGRPVVSDPVIRREILDRRLDPTLAAIMAAEKAKYDQEMIERKIGRKLNYTEAYFAHLLGTGSAGKFLKLLATNPNASAAKAFPKAAKTNRSLFYSNKGKGSAYSVAQMYKNIHDMIDRRMQRYAEFKDPSSLSFSYSEVDLE